MSTVAFIRQCLAAGMDLEMALLAAEQFEGAPQILSPRQARNARYYEAKKRLKSSETSEIKTLKTVSDDPKTVKTLSDAEAASRTSAQVVNTTSSLRSEGTQEANASFVDASKPADPEKPKTKPPKASRGTRLPEDWQPSDADVEVARSEGLSDEEIHRAATEFRNYWCSRTRDATKLSWPRTWHNRVADIGDRKRRNGPRLVASSGQPGGYGRGAVSFADIYARRHGNAAD